MPFKEKPHRQMLLRMEPCVHAQEAACKAMRRTHWERAFRT
jgi:hypothetical protein